MKVFYDLLDGIEFSSSPSVADLLNSGKNMTMYFTPVGSLFVRDIDNKITMKVGEVLTSSFESYNKMRKSIIRITTNDLHLNEQQREEVIMAYMMNAL